MVKHACRAGIRWADTCHTHTHTYVSTILSIHLTTLIVFVLIIGMMMDEWDGIIKIAMSLHGFILFDFVCVSKQFSHVQKWTRLMTPKTSIRRSIDPYTSHTRHVILNLFTFSSIHKLIIAYHITPNHRNYPFYYSSYLRLIRSIFMCFPPAAGPATYPHHT